MQPEGFIDRLLWACSSDLHSRGACRHLSRMFHVHSPWSVGAAPNYCGAAGAGEADRRYRRSMTVCVGIIPLVRSSDAAVVRSPYGKYHARLDEVASRASPHPPVP